MRLNAVSRASAGLAGLATALTLLVAPTTALADTTTNYGDVAVVNSGPGGSAVYQLTSNNAGVGYAGLEFHLSPTAPLSTITQLSTDYQETVGPFGGGSPRFTLFDDTGNFGSAYVYFGTPTGGGGFTDSNAGAYGNTGNYASLASTDARVEVNGFGGINGANSYITWAAFVAEAGTQNVEYVTLDLDAGTFVNQPDGQQLLANNFRLNNETISAPSNTPVSAAPEPGAWALMMLGVGGIGAAFRHRRRDAGALVAAA